MHIYRRADLDLLGDVLWHAGEYPNFIALLDDEERCGARRAARGNEIARIDAALGYDSIERCGHALESSKRGETVKFGSIYAHAGACRVELGDTAIEGRFFSFPLLDGDNASRRIAPAIVARARELRLRFLYLCLSF